VLAPPRGNGENATNPKLLARRGVCQESFLDKFRDEEDPETLAYFATDAYFEREFPLTKQRVYVSV